MALIARSQGPALQNQDSRLRIWGFEVVRSISGDEAVGQRIAFTA